LKSINIVFDFEKYLMIEGLRDLLSNDSNIGEKYLILLKTFTTTNKEEYYAISSVLGAFLGDSMGSYVEFKKGNPELWEEVNFNEICPIWGSSPGQLSDDSEMALSSAYGIMDSSFMNEINADRLAFYYGLWYLTNPFDIGTTTTKALKPMADKRIYSKDCSDKVIKINLANYSFMPGIYNTIKANCEKINSESESNGFLMRKTPIAIYCLRYTKVDFSDHEDHVTNWKGLIKANEVDTYNTHSHVNTIQASIIYSLIITRIICLRTKDFSKEKIAENVLSYIKWYIEKNCHHFTESRFYKDLLSCINTGNPESFKFDSETFFKHQGYFSHALCYCIKFLRNPKSYMEVMKDVICLGGDTDTNAAIVGGVVGAYWGFESFKDEDKNKENSMLYTMIKLNALKANCKRPFIYSPGNSLLYVREVLKRNNFEEKLNSAYCPLSLAVILNFVL
jgi:ADP-ribosyl-[dinitrogen reductase] hydrolase